MTPCVFPRGVNFCDCSKRGMGCCVHPSDKRKVECQEHYLNGDFPDKK